MASMRQQWRMAGIIALHRRQGSTPNTGLFPSPVTPSEPMAAGRARLDVDARSPLAPAFGCPPEADSGKVAHATVYGPEGVVDAEEPADGASADRRGHRWSRRWSGREPRAGARSHPRRAECSTQPERADGDGEDQSGT